MYIRTIDILAQYRDIEIALLSLNGCLCYTDCVSKTPVDNYDYRTPTQVSSRCTCQSVLIGDTLA